MATTHLSSIVQNPFGFDHSKADKFLSTEDHEYEISRWLKLENEPSTGAPFDLGSNSPFACSNQFYANLPNLHSEFATFTSAPYSFQLPSANNTTQSPQLPSANPVPQPTNNYTYTFAPVSSTNQQFATTPYSFQPIQYQPHFSTNLTSQLAPAYSSPTTPTQYATYTTTAPHSFSTNPQFIQIATTATNASAQQYAQSSVVPAQLFQSQFSTPASNNGTNNPNFSQSLSSQYQYLYHSHPSASGANAKAHQGDELTDDKKRKQSPRPFVRRVRQTRPKVVESKGAVQCKGRNRKKGTQCRNAALMEYIGPRPIYCAEHIELDPKSLYEKCKSPYQKEPKDNKGCKEVVLKEFGVCYKHYPDLINEMLEARQFDKIRVHNERINDLLGQLERDAAAAKKKDGDLYQRKNKLIPKFQEMKKLASRALEALDSVRQKTEFEDDLPSDLAELNAPIVLDGISVHIVESFTSSESEEDILSSPHSDSSLDEEFDAILA